jgi:hypothetical protein
MSCHFIAYRKIAAVGGGLTGNEISAIDYSGKLLKVGKKV